LSEADFDLAWAEGKNLPIEQAIELALQSVEKMLG
jgi:hypothetical protein